MKIQKEFMIVENPVKNEVNNDVVLVVDDDSSALLAAETILSVPGRQIITVESGAEALACLESQPVSLVLLDVEMPGLNGFETAKRIHQQEQLQDIPVLFLTASDHTEELIEHGFGVGAYDFLSKPLEPQLLRNKVAIFLRLYRQQQMLKQELEQRRKDEEALRLSAIVYEHSPQGIMITNAKSVIHTVNRAFEKATGYTAAEAVGQTPRLLHSDHQDNDFYKRMWQTLQETGQWQGEIWNRRKDGEIYPEWLNVVAVHNEQGEVNHYVGIFSDLSGRDQFRERLHQLAYYDVLTGLPNRRLFMDRLEVALHQVRREDRSMTLVLLDLDRFKRINDTLGHHVGDEVLKAVSERLHKQLRESDILARLDGDGFALLLQGLTENEDAARLVHKLLVSLEQPLTAGGKEFHLSASAGLSVYPNDGATTEGLLKHADTALHRTMESGGNDLQFYTHAMGVSCREHLALEGELRHAIRHQGLKLAYQPQVSLADGSLVGVEALARWPHPQHGDVPPDRFIPVAEDAGLIWALGAWALETACHQGRAWMDNYNRPLRVAVNVSAYQLRDARLAEIVSQVLARTTLPPECLELELTESMLMEAVDETMLTLRKLTELGIKLSIDDFGTGYSSLSYLKRFSFHTLKIDRSFVNGIPGDSNDVAIIDAIIAMAHSLNLKVVAEGVETVEQLKFLQEAGCDEVQGYLFSRPVPAEEIILSQDHITGIFTKSGLKRCLTNEC